MCTCKRRNAVRQTGFSFLEMMVTMLIVSFLAGVVYTTFSQGLRLWGRAMSTRSQADTEIVFEKISRDLRNAFAQTGTVFTGKVRSLGFSALIPPSDAALRARVDSESLPTQVEYVYDRAAKELLRKETDYRQMLYPGKKTRILTSTVGTGMTDCKFEFYSTDTLGKDFRWRNHWESECPPRAVRISLHFDDNKKMQTVDKIVALPITACLSEVTVA